MNIDSYLEVPVAEAKENTQLTFLKWWWATRASKFEQTWAAMPILLFIATFSILFILTLICWAMLSIPRWIVGWWLS